MWHSGRVLDSLNQRLGAWILPLSLGNSHKSEFNIKFDDRCRVWIFRSIDINQIPVCTLSNKSNLNSISSNSYNVVRK